HLEQHGLIHREFYSEHPRRARYELTDMGSGLAQIIGTMAVWGSRYLLPDAPLTHAECGSRLEAGFYCASCDERVSGSSVKLPQPGH
ncbi:MAG: winged helix-turn-helix transcriptional regulator, partial [Pseudomonadales bacterium]